MRLLQNKNGKVYSLKRSLLIIFTATLCISGSAWLLFFVAISIKERYSQDEKYTIRAILQTGPEWEALKTVYLAEAMGLSIDKPTNLFSFNEKQAQKNLLQQPIFKEVVVKKIKPDTVFVDYTVRHPIAYLGDYSNTGIDEEGVTFPTFPFFTPKRLPEVFFDEDVNKTLQDQDIWGQKLTGPSFAIVEDLLKLFSREAALKTTQLIRIDLSQIFEKSYGKKQIVLIVEDQILQKKAGQTQHCSVPRILRLTPKNYHRELAQFITLKEKLLKEEQNAPSINSVLPMIIDLRVPQVAYIHK